MCTARSDDSTPLLLQMTSFGSFFAVMIGTSLITMIPVKASYQKCKFTNNSGETTVQYAEIHGHTGNIILHWDDGGKTNFAVMPDMTYRDEGNNLWVLNFQRDTVGMTRADGATMICE